MTVDPAGKRRLLLGIRWHAVHIARHAHAEVRIGVRRALGHGRSDWPTYLVSVRLLKTLG